MEKQTNIVFLASLDAFKNRMDKNNYNMFTNIVNNSKYNVVFTETEQKLNDFLLNNKDVLIIDFTYFCCDSVEYKNAKKVVYVEDVKCVCKYKCEGESKKCNFTRIKQYVENNNIEFAFVRYFTYLTKNIVRNSKNIIKFPYYFNTDIYKDNNSVKNTDVLFYGATYPESYPFRNRMYKILKHTTKFNVKFLPYSKKNSKSMITGSDLVSEINKSWLTITTKSINNLLLAKYYEVALCGSVPCGDYPDLEDDYLKNNMIYIDNSMTDEEIINKIYDSLQNKNKLYEMKKNINTMFSNKFDSEKFIDFFDGAINCILNS